MPTIEQDLIAFGDLAHWSPKVGDVVHKDGLFVRWIAVVCALKDDVVEVRLAGNPRLLASGDYKTQTINFRKIRSSFVGAYYVTSNGTYYV